MAIRPVFIPCRGNFLGAEEKLVEFKWHPGMALSQKQKTIDELHSCANRCGYERVLEVSSKSKVELGVQLSAFNLMFETEKFHHAFSVECAFQGSKVFKNGGPYKELLEKSSREAKKDIRLKESGALQQFDFFGEIFPLEPLTFFYDWLYINALAQNADAAKAVLAFDSFTDIEFNPKKSINCQARSVALFVSLVQNNVIDDALMSSKKFLNLLQNYYVKHGA